jgi:hypothetical protein
MTGFIVFQMNRRTRMLSQPGPSFAMKVVQMLAARR